jgi:tetratricopeptide (TPR) repeat protein
MLIENEYYAAGLIFLAAFLLLPYTSNILESDLNFSLSEPVRFVIVLLLFAGSMVVDNHELDHKLSSVFSKSEAIGDVSTSNPNINVCFYDWKWYTTSNIGYSSAPYDYEYAVVTLYLKNEADTSISTNPYSWDFIAGGIKYSIDSATFDSSIDHQTVDVLKGGKIETKIVYLIKKSSMKGSLNYNRVSSPTMQRISHYDLITLGNSDEALKRFDKAIELTSQNLDLWISKGLALIELNKYDDALKAFDKAIELNPQNENSWVVKGEALISLNKSYEAISASNKAIEIVPQ